MKSSNPQKAPLNIDEETIKKALLTVDDFGHEMRIKHILESKGGRTYHGWTYLDPLEAKPRQFDLRALFAITDRRRVHMAVECKNLSNDAPLIISGTKRTKEEAFHDFVASESTATGVRIHIKRAQADSYLFRQNEFVGKSLLRLKPNQDGSALVSTSALESEIYNRWTQALSSADELCKKASLAAQDKNNIVTTLIIPAVVVPDRTLWSVEYGATGLIIDGPKQTDFCTIFVNHEIAVLERNYWMNLSHVCFFTEAGLLDFLTRLWAPGGLLTDLFPESATDHQPPRH